jgi:type IX secretion system PorP/SprF family membrane protein
MGKTQLLPVLTYHKAVSQNKNTYLSVGFLGGPVQQRFDPTNLKFDDQFVNGAYSSTNPTQQTFNKTNITYWDASAGILFSSSFGNSNNYYIGGSYFHFNEPKVAFSSLNDIRLNKKIMINGGLSVPTSETDRLIFYGDYFVQGGNNQAQAGIMYRHDWLDYGDDEVAGITVGAFTRWNDAIIPVVKLDLYKWAFGLTYDVNISKLRSASEMRGGFELTVSLKSFLNIRNSSMDKMRCPVPF